MVAMSRRITAWMALLAMLSGLGLPLHAYAQLARAGGPGGDLCTAGKMGQSTPASPDRQHATACDMCCGCAADGAAPAPTPQAAIVRAALVAIDNAGFTMRSALKVGAALPRGPPLFS
jgi:hypothetical protein